MAGAPWHLTEQEIDDIIAVLRREEGREWLRKSRYDDGLVLRAGVFYHLSFEEGSTFEQAFSDEASLRRFLAALDLEARDSFRDLFVREMKAIRER